ncbi:TRC40/GET3/ArsA family transport-energizing ATPase [Aggregatilineales bacterium SYSU G02658]
MTEFIFFSGKGGVGKTTMACTTAVRAADSGKRVLIVTTDPASNLSDVFEQPIGHQITPIAAVPNLWAMEIDADRATDEYKDRALAPVRGVFPEAMVAVMEEQMSGPCTVEIAAFDRFTDFLDQPAVDGVRFDVVIFDTAPTGHTLRLIELPFEWSRSIDDAAQGSGQTCIGPVAAIQESKLKYERAIATMRDPEQTRFIFVLQPEATSIKETKRAVGELEKLGITSQEIIINGVLPPEEAVNPLFASRIAMQNGYLSQIERELPLKTQRMYLLDGEVKGVERLRAVAGVLFDHLPVASALNHAAAPTTITETPADTARIFERLLPQADHPRTLFFAGKGGVGKTVASCATAFWLAEQGYKTLLLTTDPAAHLGDVLGVTVGSEVAPVKEVPNLWAANIDPKAAATIYVERILTDARARGRSPEAIQMMEEELNSPCTEEMAAFDRFIECATESDWDVVVFDTAPTGHTLRLLELPLDWSAQLDVKVFASTETATVDDVARQRFERVIDMMRDPNKSTFAFVMYPEATPILEAHRASQELAALGIPTGLVFANYVLPAAACTTPFSRARRAMQEHYLAEIAKRFDVPVVHLPLFPYEIKGLEVLSQLGEQVFKSKQIVS